eukprot:scaffold3281_cov55-Attheya_sp.AAC.4
MRILFPFIGSRVSQSLSQSRVNSEGNKFRQHAEKIIIISAGRRGIIDSMMRRPENTIASPATAATAL